MGFTLGIATRSLRRSRGSMMTPRRWERALSCTSLTFDKSRAIRTGDGAMAASKVPRPLRAAGALSRWEAPLTDVRETNSFRPSYRNFCDGVRIHSRHRPRSVSSSSRPTRMSFMQQTSPPGADGHTLLLCRSRSRWWLEIELALVVIVAVAGYFSRMTDLSVRGEESRRGLIAQEMLRTGDWIVPRCQGIPLFSRPPLQNWLIAGMALVRGEVDAFCLRFPSDCA